MLVNNCQFSFWAWIEEKVEEGGIYSFFFLPSYFSWDMGLLLTLDWHLHHWFSDIQTWIGIMSPAFLGLLADVRSWGFSASITEWASSLDEISLYLFPHIYVYVCVHTYAYMCICIYISIISISINLYLHICIYICICIDVSLISVSINLYLYLYLYLYVSISIYPIAFVSLETQLPINTPGFFVWEWWTRRDHCYKTDPSYRAGQYGSCLFS